MSSARILVVEDSAIIARDIQQTLRKLGYDVPVTYRSGETAIELVASLKPDLVLMDIVLAGKLDGIETAATIRARHDLPVVYVTAHADQATLERAKITEPFGYVLKPFGARELQVAIEIALYKHRAEAERARLALALEAASREIRTLRGIIPICAWCKKVRDDEGYWTQLDQYVSTHSDAQMSHGICPTCSAKALAEDSEDEHSV